MPMSMLLTWPRMPWKCQESCIWTQCSARIVIRYLLDQVMFHTSRVGLNDPWETLKYHNKMVFWSCRGWRTTWSTSNKSFHLWCSSEGGLQIYARWGKGEDHGWVRNQRPNFILSIKRKVMNLYLLCIGLKRQIWHLNPRHKICDGMSAGLRLLFSIPRWDLQCQTTFSFHEMPLYR